MAYQGNYPNYPNLDQPGIYQPYPPQPNPAYPYAYKADAPYYEEEAKHELHQPLIHNKKDSKQGKSNKKRATALIFLIACLIFESTGLARSVADKYLFEYCYWDFNLFSFYNDFDVSLPTNSYSGNIDRMYDSLQCYNYTEVYPECPNICPFVLDLNDGFNWAKYAFGISAVLSVVTLIVYISHCACKKPKLKKKGAGFLLISSYLAFLIGVGIYVMKSNLYYRQYDDIESHNEEVDNLKNLDYEDGAKDLIGMLLFMLIYRIIVISITK